jgi:hypothetical protein
MTAACASATIKCISYAVLPLVYGFRRLHCSMYSYLIPSQVVAKVLGFTSQGPRAVRHSFGLVSTRHEQLSEGAKKVKNRGGFEQNNFDL